MGQSPICPNWSLCQKTQMPLSYIITLSLSLLHHLQIVGSKPNHRTIIEPNYLLLRRTSSFISLIEPKLHSSSPNPTPCNTSSPSLSPSSNFSLFPKVSSFSPSYLPISLFMLMGIIMGMSFFFVLTYVLRVANSGSLCSFWIRKCHSKIHFDDITSL